MKSRTRTLNAMVVVLAVMLSVFGDASAASGVWAQTAAGTYEWLTPGNWTGGNVPNLAGETATLTPDLAGGAIINLTGAITVGGMTIGDSNSTVNGQYPFTINANGGSLILNNSGAGVTITKSGSGNFFVTDTINAGVTLNDAVTLASSVAKRTLSIAGNIGESGKRNVTIDGGNDILREILLTGTNTYSGTTTFKGGKLSFNSLKNANGSASALGAPANATDGTIAVGNGVNVCYLNYIGGSDSITDRKLDLVGTTGEVTLNVEGSKLTFTTPFGFSGSGAKQLTLASVLGVAGAGEIQGAIADSTSGVTSVRTLNSSGAVAPRPWTLIGLSTYTGPTSVEFHELLVNTIANVQSPGIASAVGAPTTVVNGTIKLGNGNKVGKLTYIGNGHTTDRVFDLAGATTAGGGTLNASGFGKLTVISPLTATGTGAKTLTLGGTGVGELTAAATITNTLAGATDFTKSDAGTWIVRSPARYTGNVTLAGGTLQVVNGALAASPATLTLTAGTLQGLGGDLNLNNSGTVANSGVSGSQNITFTAGTLAALTGSGNRTLDSSLDAGKTLTLNNLTLHPTTAVFFSIDGSGDTVVNGVIADGSATSAGLWFRNRGTTTIKNNNTYVTPTSISGGGTVVLDYDAASGSKFADAGALKFGEATGGNNGGNLV